MSNPQRSSAPKAIYKPGELESTRKNLGEISPEEARRVANLLGGEIGVEKVPEFQPIKHSTYNKAARPSTASKNRSSSSESESSKKHSLFSGKDSSSSESAKSKEKPSILPPVTKKEQAYFDKLMTYSEHKIKKNMSFFSRLFSMGKTQDRVSADFVSVRLLTHIHHMDKFFSCISSLVNNAESDFRLKVQTYETDKYKFFRFASSFSMTKIKNMQKELSEHSENVTVSDLVPITKEIYRPLLKIFYLGEERIVNFIKEAMTEIVAGRKSVQIKLMPLVREACSEWIYIYHQVIKGLYPLLMRMCSTEVLPFARFFNKNSAKILDFLEMTKFDLILPDADPKEAEKKEAERIKEESKKEKDDSSKDENAEEVEELDDDDIEESSSDKKRVYIPKSIQQALKTLEMIFPDVGWQDLGNGTDMYPYFQPLYRFSDGYNLLSENNPMQVTITLIRILEDFFQGVRNIRFVDEKEGSKDDSYSDVFSDWSAYIEVVFERDYLPTMKEISNHVSTQPDFITTPYARKQIASMLWETRTMFLPYLNYDYFFMEKEVHSSAYKPLSRRVEFLKESWTRLLQTCDEEKKASSVRGTPFSSDAVGVENIMKPYSFAMENIVSRRLNSLVPPKNRSNLTLLKYTYSVLLVLHWWISDPKSPAYSMSTTIPYRTAPDGSFLFAVATRTDQNAVFTRAVKMRQAEIKAKLEATSAKNIASSATQNAGAKPNATAAPNVATKPNATVAPNAATKPNATVAQNTALSDSDSDIEAVSD